MKSDIKKNIFSDTVIHYITNEMRICIDDLTKKILSDTPRNSKFFNNLFMHMIALKIPYEYEDDVSSSNNDENRKYINESLCDFFSNYGLNEDKDKPEYFIFDNIRHAFINYKQGGVLQMYQYREAEEWYPKVIIDDFLGNKDDISALNQNITVYRGTSIDEFNSKKFGQSWSLSKKIAEEFAFKHYDSQPNYQDTKRVILETLIKKDIILFYVKDGIEEEVIINSNNLNMVLLSPY